MDKVSIIVPVYNGEKYLKRCVDSLINQTYQNIEIILINDGSTDNSLDIIKSYDDSRIKVIDKKNTGVSDTRNKAIKKATGNYICFCDCDDFYDKEYVKTMYNLIQTKDVPIVRCNYKVIDNKDKIIGKGNLEEGEYNFFDIKNDLISKCLDGQIPCFSYLLMINKDNLNIEFPTDIAMMEDVVFYIDLLLKVDRIYVTDACLYTIMYNEEGATNNLKNYERNINHILSVNKKIHKILKENELDSKSNILKLNTNNLNSISDFIFKYYLYGDDYINFCKKINNDNLKLLISNTDLSRINIVRRTLLKLLLNDNYFILKFYFKFRSIIHSLKR